MERKEVDDSKDSKSIRSICSYVCLVLSGNRKKNAGHVHSIVESEEGVKLVKITRACVKCTIGKHMFGGTQKSNSLWCSKHDDTGCTVDVKKY